MFDGLVEPKNPGGCGCWGFALWTGSKNCHKDFGYLGNPEWMSNNYAEYCSLGFGLRKIHELNLPAIQSLTVLGDSQLVINQISGLWQIKSSKLIPLQQKCLDILDSFDVDWVARWVPRDINAIADELSRKAYKKWQNQK